MPEKSGLGRSLEVKNTVRMFYFQFNNPNKSANVTNVLNSQ